MNRNTWGLISLFTLLVACGGASDTDENSSGGNAQGGTTSAGAGGSTAGKGGNEPGGAGNEPGGAGNEQGGAGNEPGGAGNEQGGAGNEQGGAGNEQGGNEPGGGGAGGSTTAGQGGSTTAGAGGSTTAGAGGQAQGGKAGSGGSPAVCKTDKDCPLIDKETLGHCVEGKCVYVPVNPCKGLACGSKCTTCIPGQPCPDVEMYCSEDGKCSTTQPQCGGDKCKTPEECPKPKGPCQTCSDGTLSCPTATCENNQCGVAYEPPCKDAQCKVPEDCPVPLGPCKICWDGSSACPQATCEGGKCGVKPPSCPPQTDECAADKVKGSGGCDVIQGYYWDGKSCQALSGCKCEGECDKLSKTLLECEKKHSNCNSSSQCKVDNDCPVLGGPCQLCLDGSNACPTGQCIQGQCYTNPGICKDSCNTADAIGVGDCKKQLGFVWDGTSCVSLVGCECKGSDCNTLTDQKTCEKLHVPCSSCKPVEAVGVGDCKKLLGSIWDGKTCKVLVGCECKGPGCSLLTNEKACVENHKGCNQTLSPCDGKKCGDTCSNCTGKNCPPVMEYCSAKGECSTAKPLCSGSDI